MEYREKYEEWISNPYLMKPRKKNLNRSQMTMERSKNGSIKTWNLGRQDCEGDRSGDEPLKYLHR